MKTNFKLQSLSHDPDMLLMKHQHSHSSLGLVEGEKRHKFQIMIKYFGHGLILGSATI